MFFSFSVVTNLCTPWTAPCQASPSFTIFQSFLKLMSIDSVMPSNHLILCCPLLLLSSMFPNMSWLRWPVYWSFSFHCTVNTPAKEKKMPPESKSIASVCWDGGLCMSVAAPESELGVPDLGMHSTISAAGMQWDSYTNWERVISLQDWTSEIELHFPAAGSQNRQLQAPHSPVFWSSEHVPLERAFWVLLAPYDWKISLRFKHIVITSLSYGVIMCCWSLAWRNLSITLLACETMQLCGSLSILWHCLSLGLEWKLTFSSPVATAEFSKFFGILSAALS